MADAPLRPVQDERRPRRVYLDWARGVAVLIMIEAHLLDSWTADAARETTVFAWGIKLGGIGAPLFLALAGVSVALSAASKARRSGSIPAAARAVARRGLDIFLLAFVFRAQAWILSMGPPRTLLRVDILNIMGPSMIVAAVMWGLAGTRRRRAIAYGIATLAMTLLTPVVRAWSGLAALPDPLEAYLRPVAGLANFTFLPSAGFLFAGALFGLFLDDTRAAGDERRLNVALGLGGVLLVATAYAASFGPALIARSDFWTSSPSFFFIRLGLLAAMVALAYLWMARSSGARWSPIRQLGRTSLFIYWIHVELVYGLISSSLHRALSLPQATVAFVVFTAVMLLCSVIKDRVAGWWQARAQRVPSEASVSNGAAGR